jgi:hypothetical protein
LNWGDSVIENIRKDLKEEFPGVKGFSRRNLFRVINFYNTYKASSIVPPLVAQIGWSQNCIIIQSCKTHLEREFYIRLTIKERLSKRSLQQKIQNKEYEKWTSSQNNFQETLPVDIATEAQVAFKDDYTALNKKVLFSRFARNTPFVIEPAFDNS